MRALTNQIADIFPPNDNYCYFYLVTFLILEAINMKINIKMPSTRCPAFVFSVVFITNYIAQANTVI